MAVNVRKLLDAKSPEQAVAWLRARGYQPTFDYKDLWEASDRNAFAIAGITSIDLLDDFRDSIARAIENGMPFQTFRAEAEKILRYHGWWGPAITEDPITGRQRTVKIGDANRLEIIYRTNVMAALSAGRAEHIAQVAAERAATGGGMTYLRYHAILDERDVAGHFCHDHHGIVLPYNHPVWRGWTPPIHYQCRCFLQSFSADDLRALGYQISPSPVLKWKQYTNQRTGYKTRALEGVEPGFGRHDWEEQVQAMFKAYLRKVSPENRDAFENEFISAHAVAINAEMKQRRVARTIIVQDGKVWLFGTYDEPLIMFPGGGIEEFESPERGAIREAKEETGFDVEIISWLADFDDQYSHRSYYLAKRIGGEMATVDQDGDRPCILKLVPFETALEMLTSPYDKAALETLMGELEKRYTAAHKFNPDEPRGPDGKWGKGGAPSKKPTKAKPEPKKPFKLEPSPPEGIKRKRVKIKRVSTPAFTGKPVPLKTEMKSQESGALGERIAMEFARKHLGFKDIQPTHEVRNNYPYDLFGDHTAIEVKTGQIKATKSAQQWRVSFDGNQSKTENDLLKRMTPEQKRKYNAGKGAAAMERKKTALAEISSKHGKPIAVKEIALIVNLDTKTADIFMFDQIHKRIGWREPRVKEAYQGTFRYAD